MAHHSPSLPVGAGSCSEISADSIGDYSICFKENILFGYFDYRGDEDMKHWEKMASDPKLGMNEANSAQGFSSEALWRLSEASNLSSMCLWSFGSMALMSGFLGRVAAGGLFIIFTGALIVHLPEGWTLNWFGSKKGGGIEYFVLLLSFLLVIVLKRSGALSIDYWLTSPR